MRLYDSAQKKLIDFSPTDPIGMYVCGITPYDSAHLGHIFTFMTYDILTRRLCELGHTVTTVRNITDVDDPLFAKAAQTGTPYQVIAQTEIDSFHDVLGRLNFLSVEHEPKVSENIIQIATAVKTLLDDGYGYYIDKDIYFDISKIEDYGTFSGYKKTLRHALLADRGGKPDLANKRQPSDFLLWTNVDDPNDSAVWATPLGSRGRPGWHIECTVMGTELLGSHFAIHGGGTDLIYPHHESEIAQNLALHGTSPADIWLHVAPLTMAGEKMSKSLGNLIFAKDVLTRYEPNVLRLALMRYHHRIGGEWHDTLLDTAKSLVDSLRKAQYLQDAKHDAKLLHSVRTAIDSNINMPKVITALEHYVDVEDGLSHRDVVSGDFIRAMNLLGIVL